jgi:uncharacterized protein YbcC (UPF0753/DUF2309 family)
MPNREANVRSWPEAIAVACSRIAPNWPLDRAIAVNPAWGWIDQPIEKASSRLRWLCGSSLLEPCQPSPRLSLCSSLLSQDWNARRIDSLSQLCAAFFDQDQALWGSHTREASLFAFWCRQSALDPTFQRLCGRVPVALAEGSYEQAILHILEEFQLPGIEDYLTAVLLDLNGWAAWCAYLAWQARLEGGHHDALEQLLAILLTWEWCLYRKQAGCGADWLQRLKLELQRVPLQEQDWSHQLARERDFQKQVHQQLTEGPLELAPTAELQAVFCIDVRSEVWRRALEACHPSIQTLGYAGFFGLPAEYLPLAGRQARPQLPGLLAPRVRISDCGANAQQLVERRRARLNWEDAWDQIRGQPLAAFHFVESIGLGYAWKLLRSSLGWSQHGVDSVGLTPCEQESLHPRLQGLNASQSVDLADGVLRGMGLIDQFAPTVLLVAHASSSLNNAHAAALDCGACCGQSGEVNARALAALLNDPGVREGLTLRGIVIPSSTSFLAALHNTTTDEVLLLEGDPGDPRLQAWLKQAAHQARSERAARLGLSSKSPARLAKAVSERGRDWSQVRPEWGLANNAGLVIAPRLRTRAAHFGGRCFLHEYRSDQDRDGSVLAQILGGPLVVAHWINLQYYASVVDPQRWGSGDKLLHNVVGGRIGVLEGGSGDLRIGLPKQSLHDGQQWVHEPLRLSVWIEASRDLLEQSVKANPSVLQLIEGGWVHLLHIDPRSGLVSVAQGLQAGLAWKPFDVAQEMRV